ncbi:MAG: CDP-alcohol phosphatidyltransferase family protein [Chitinophagales bacterium]|nr:CDP-alcohol phosphatidyltransferase family protein [Chitinophagales bacterium]MDW8427768.1 CDP-alcohol phosphatidyltransferase family protein [Chitinophagales bacterium]
MRSFLPNLFTLGNLLAGCAGIVFCFSERVVPVRLQEADPVASELLITLGYSQRLYLASFMVFVAAALDFLDGFLARLLRMHSELGKALDALADVVSFGVLPASILYQLLLASWSAEPDALLVPMIYPFFAYIVVLAAAYRLARFTVQSQHTSFAGLPAPAAALLIAALPLIIFTNNLNLGEVVGNKWVLYSLAILLSWFMLAPLPMFGLKFTHYRWRGNELRYLFLATAAVFIGAFAYAGIALAVLGYIAVNGVIFLFNKKNFNSY